jgi:hypothetical protein
MNLLGTSFLDYALYLASLLMMKNTLLNGSNQNVLSESSLNGSSFVYQVLSVYKRRIHYWKLTQAYSRVLRVAFGEYVQAKSQSLRSIRFQTSIEYGSIENHESRDVDSNDEAKKITELMSHIISEGNNTIHIPDLTPQSNISLVSDALLDQEILDFDSILAAQGAANAIQVSLSTANDKWWNDLFGEEPMNMDQDFLLQQDSGTDMSGMF